MNSKFKLILLIIAFGFGIGVYEFYDFYTVEMEKMQQDRSAKEASLETQKSELKRLESFASNIQTIKQELKELSLQLEAALEHMPRNFNLASLMRKMTLLAHNSGIELTTFKPRKGEEKEGNSFYSTIQIEFALHGSFTQTLVFFDQLSRLKRIINIESIKLAAVASTPQQRNTAANAAALDTNVTIKTYRFSE